MKKRNNKRENFGFSSENLVLIDYDNVWYQKAKDKPSLLVDLGTCSNDSITG